MELQTGSETEITTPKRTPQTGEDRRPFWLRGWHYVLQLTSLAIFFGVGAVITLTATAAGPWLARRVDDARGQRTIQGLFSFFTWWLQVTGLVRIRFHRTERLSEPQGAIFAANHPGLLDAVFILSQMPRAICVIRGGLMDKLAFAGGARIAGYISNDRGTTLVRQGIRKISAGENLVIFPEGTRTRTEAVNAFKKGFALIAVRTGAPIYPVLIERSGHYLAKGTPLLEPARIPIEISLSVEEPVYAEPNETASELAARMQAWFEERLVNTQSGVYRVAGASPVE